MTAVGGFFGREPAAASNGPWHTEAVALTSGRACLRAMLELMRPGRVLLPFYICDAALAPIRALGLPHEFYGLTPSLDPGVDDWPADAVVLVVNYFDLKNEIVRRLTTQLGERLIVDDTQAFFRRRPKVWAFNSARKFFGVADGAYMYGPRAREIAPKRANDAAPSEHLETKLTGDPALAYRQYVAAEAEVSSDTLAPSTASTRALDRVGYGDARAARRRNFALLHDGLGGRNTLSTDFTLDADAGPFCYPFLPETPALHEALWRREIFVPRLWPEVVTRAGGGFGWERDLASRLLPLPIDHRYGAREMARVTEAVLEVVA